MAAKKMFPPGAVGELSSKTYDEVRLRIGFRVQTCRANRNLARSPSSLTGKRGSRLSCSSPTVSLI
jgi:hypothetical protein